MSCCAPFEAEAAGAGRSGPAPEEVALASRPLGENLFQTDLAVPAIHCGACIRTIETALNGIAGIESARVNLSTKRVAIRWRKSGDSQPPFVSRLVALGYEPHLYDAGGSGPDPILIGHIKALAVAAFASMNIMMLSGSVWSGATGDARSLMHWLCAGLALPVLLYSGRIFYVSAWTALRHGHTNMDVPISIGVALAFALSLYDTIMGGPHTYFDAATTLVFFLLVGRTLDHVMRERTRTAVRNLARMAPRGALVVNADGSREYLPLSEVTPGMQLLLVAGERVPVDASVVSGRSDLDRSLVSGESVPVSVGPGDRIEAGTLNLTGPLLLRSEAAERDSTLAEMLRMMEAAEGGRSRYRRIADRAAAFYSPAVHLTALLAFVGWMIYGGDLHQSVTIAIAVLIVTCPCALGLAVPMVQVVAARRLFDAGIMVKDGSALERLAEIDSAVFDKTGTLTLGDAVLAGASEIAPKALTLAAALAAHSRHPHSRAIAAAAGANPHAPAFETITELAGCGIEAELQGARYRLGRAEWALAPGSRHPEATVLARDGKLVAAFRFSETLRPGATAAIAELKRQDIAVEIASGDRAAIIAPMAEKLGIPTYIAGALPAGKLARLEELRVAGHKTLMVGDGINDAAALAGAYVSMAPASAAEIGRNAADFVFLHKDLGAVPQALGVARAAARLVKQNFAIAIFYNVVAIPLAVLGLVTPFIAAIAMSASSLVVVANALRLGRGRKNREHEPLQPPAIAEATP